MWKGRFKEEQSDLLKSYGASVHVDWQLYRQDIRGSIAHARALLGGGDRPGVVDRRGGGLFQQAPGGVADAHGRGGHFCKTR